LPVFGECCGTLPRFRIRQLEHEAQSSSEAALPEIGDWDAGTVTPPSKGSNVQLAINTATLGAMGSLAAPQVCAFYRAERLAIAVVRIDEVFVELEPDALALGAPRKTRDEHPR
jgi:hypothetical protein